MSSLAQVSGRNPADPGKREDEEAGRRMPAGLFVSLSSFLP